MSVKKRKLKWNIIKRLLVDLVYLVTLTGVILFLCDSTEAIYDTLKDIATAKALLCIAIFMFTVQRVRLINWQSGVYTLVYWPLAIWYLQTHLYGADIEAKNNIIVWFVWIIGLIVVDMVVYKKSNKLQQMNKLTMSIYAFMTISMIYFRNGRYYPLLLVVPTFVYYLIPISEKEWKRLISQFCNAWLISFVIVMIRSFIENPYTGGRYYGCFVNIGTFGLFIAGVFVVALYRIYQSKQEYGRRSVAYVISWVWMAGVLVAMWIIDTRTMIVGVTFSLIVMFVFLRKDVSRRKLLIRSGIIAAIFVVSLLIGYAGLKGLSYLAVQRADSNAEVSKFFAPVMFAIDRAEYVFYTESFSDAYILEPNTLINEMDLFTSGRISIIKAFSESFNFEGNLSNSVNVGFYVALNAHNEYVQVIYEYGYIGGGSLIIYLIYTMIQACKRYLGKRSIGGGDVLWLLWIPMLLGVMTGEVVRFRYPILFMSFVLAYPLFCDSVKSVMKKTNSVDRA